MTERLSQLLHDEATALDVPPPDAHAALTRGRGLRRRRTAATAAVAAAVVAALGAGGVVAVDNLRGEDTVQLSDAAAYEQHGVWMADGALHVGNHTVDIDAKINTVHYTSAGVVVVSGPTGDQPVGPEDGYLTLVRPDGTKQALEPRLVDVEAATSPDSPLLAFARPAGSGYEAVVWDVATDKLVATVPFDGGLRWAGWAAPPVAISGDVVYASVDREVLAINWKTGTVEPLPGAPGSRWEEVRAGVWADEQSGQVVVRDLAGSELLTVPVDSDFAESYLSPDGRYVVVVPEDDFIGEDAEPATMHEIASGEARALPGDTLPLGWTPDGHALRLVGHEIRSCTAIDSACTTVGQVDDPESVRLAEAYYGS
ncbi:MAG TPA: hypothetical protein VFO49_20245 [Nocardioides sp.]|nr:hypothetical protein [Nocardioides sp.]